jgi:dTDP-4-dehydrorhamnose 3,5-epimerase
MEPLGIDGSWVFTPQVHSDHRGCFFEWFRGQEVTAHLGFRPDVVQGNCSVSRRGVIRGIHFVDVPPGQAKYVMCVSGAVLDVVVDLRVGSPTFARWEAVQLDAEARRAVYISEGLGHAFMALSDQATVLYLCTAPFNPAHEHCVHPLDPRLGVAWPHDTDVVLSAKDAAAPSLDEAIDLGLLPDYGRCIRHASRQEGPEPL